MTSRHRLLVCSITLGAIVLESAPARAGDEAAAEALFMEGKRLSAAGKYAEACPKLAESNRLDRGAGTLIHLADCYEKNRQTASAWATFKDAASAAQASGRADWQKLATSRAAALEPKLARLTIRVLEPAEKIEVTRDGSPMSAASWGTPLPVDVGPHTVQATAPGRAAFKVTVDVTKDGERLEAVVPKLGDAPAVAAAPRASAAVVATGDGPAAAPDATRGSAQRTVGFVIGGVGIAGLAAGAITGLVAMGKNDDSKQACPDDGPCASAGAVDANDGARTFGTVSTIAFVAGGVGVALGAVLVLTAPSPGGSSTRAAAVSSVTHERRASVRLAPASDGRSAGFSVMGVF